MSMKIEIRQDRTHNCHLRRDAISSNRRTNHHGKQPQIYVFLPLYHPSVQRSPTPLFQDDNNDTFSEGHEHLSKCYDDCQELYISNDRKLENFEGICILMF